jgi:hypothetical protein
LNKLQYALGPAFPGHETAGLYSARGLRSPVVRSFQVANDGADYFVLDRRLEREVKST